jgi:hypothetical protein
MIKKIPHAYNLLLAEEVNTLMKPKFTLQEDHHAFKHKSLLFSSWLQIKDAFAEGKDLVVTVMSTVGEEQICTLKDIGPRD